MTNQSFLLAKNFGRLFGVVVLGLLSNAWAAPTWDVSNLAEIFHEISYEICYIEEHQEPSPKGIPAISRALEKVFLPDTAIVKMAKEMSFSGKRGEHRRLISQWQSIATYTLALALHYRDQIDINLRAENYFHSYFAAYGAFSSLVRDLPRGQIQKALGLTDDQLARQAPVALFVDDELAATGQPSEYHITWEATQKDVLRRYLQEEGILVMEQLPHASLGPATSGSVFEELRELKEVITQQTPQSLNFLKASTCQPLALKNVHDPDLRVWLEFINNTITALQRATLQNGRKLTQEFSRFNFVLNFADDVAPAAANLDWATSLQGQVQPRLFAVLQNSGKHPKTTQVVQLKLNLYPAARIAAVHQGPKLLKKQLSDELRPDLLAATAPAALPTTPNLWLRLQKYNQDPKRHVDQIIDLLDTHKAPCGKNVR